MIKGRYAACKKTGFVMRHAAGCESVAERMNCIILFREPGKAAQGLIADHYGMKGFRIDTKSCNWGPMRGFVCADPRLSKPKDAKSSYCVRNVEWTQEAIAGHIKHEWFGHPAGEDVDSWRADVMPIVLSTSRIDELVKDGAIGRPIPDGHGCMTGISTQKFGDDTGTVRLPWRLVPTDGKSYSWLRDENGNLPLPGRYFIVCVDRNSSTAFEQRYLTGVSRIAVAHRGQEYEALLGMINPGTKHRGFKACVTADYDLFATWPSRNDAMAGQHSVVGQLAQLGASDRNLSPSAIRRARGATTGTAAAMPTGVARMTGIDDRLKSAGHSEHFRYGDVSARVLTMKVLLNTAIQADGGYRGGNAIHHNDEAGNFMLAKDNLMECLPVIVFAPKRLGFPSQTLCVENLEDFHELGVAAEEKGFTIIAKEAWKKSAGLLPATGTAS